MKKRLLILSHALELGGAEKSLIGLLNALDPKICDIDLFLLRQEGELMGEIPPYINLLPQIPAYTVLARPMKDTLKEGHIILSAARLVGKIAAARYDRIHKCTDSDVALEYSHKFTCPLMPAIRPDKEYDLAISFLTPHYFVARKVRAKKKIAWIHTDYSRVQVNVPSETAMWRAYDYIASISDAVTDSFLAIFPELRDRIILIENILPERLVKKQADAFSVKDEMSATGWRLLSIGRFCNAKNFDSVPDICYRLRERGLDITWYLIGFGGDEALIRRKIKDTKMQDYVKILGKKENPYPYIEQCDWYIQPSRFEGKSVTVREAQLLHKPVIIADYPTSKSQVVNGYDGVIVPRDNEKCAEAIADIINNKRLRDYLINNTYKEDYSNKEEIKKLYALIGEK